MSLLSREILEAEVPSASVRIWWLGQAGFAFKTHSGKIVYVDPYLSDAVERLFGFKRLSLPPITAEEVRADWIILTHEHADHLDPDAIPIIARRNRSCRFAVSAGCVPGLGKAGVTARRQIILRPLQTQDLGELIVRPIAADHGEDCPTALGMVLDFDGIRVFVTGDTAMRLNRLEPVRVPTPDLVIPCINGGFGNMNHLDAAQLVQQMNPRYAIPCHYWTFAEQGAADPGGFVHACRQFCPEVQALLLKPGEAFTLNRAVRRKPMASGKRK